MTKKIPSRRALRPYTVAFYSGGQLHFVPETFGNLRDATSYARAMVPDGMETMEVRSAIEYWVASKDRGQTWAAAAISSDAFDLDMVRELWLTMVPRPVPARSLHGIHTG